VLPSVEVKTIPELQSWLSEGEADLFNAKGAWKNKIYGRVVRSPIWIVAKTEGFPRGSHEDIFRLSDPPYFTASSNPFLKSL
jgi:hypothetical protein